MKRILCTAGMVLALCAGLAYAGIDMAQYGRDLQNLRSLSEELARDTEAGSLAFSRFDAWFKNFKVQADAFEHTYIADLKQQESFQQARSGILELSTAMNVFKQSEDAKKQYLEFSTGSDMGYAQQWKATAEKKRAAAIAAVAKGSGCLLEACRLYDAGK